MDLSDPTVVGFVYGALAVLGINIGTPIANALRRPRLEKAMEKKAETKVQQETVQLVAKDEDQARELNHLRAIQAAQQQVIEQQGQTIDLLKQRLALVESLLPGAMNGHRT